ncbi:MAG: ribonucleoside triphosphate reductase [Thermodesulfovibrio sp.]|nr:ribonucleoside triphosphate reductase [Thermodesulfovibrio sp.]
MFKNIIKRDGRVVPFDPEKITKAISKAGKATGEFDYDTARRLTIKVLLLAEELIRDRDPHVEEIQDIVEEILLSSPYRKTAKAYIIYRDQHARMREIARQGGLELIENYLSKVDWRVKENSNMSFSLQGLNNYISSEISKSYWLHKIYPPEVRDAHINGDLHIHDLNVIAPYCVGWDLMDLLVRGFGGVSGKVESRPAKHFRSALGQVVNFLFTLQGEAAGAQAFSNVDTLLAPFIAYDALNYKQVKQSLQEWVFNLNVPTRVGFQCLSEDTEILTLNGWKKYNEIEIGDSIYTFNIKTGEIESKCVRYVFREYYKGVMYCLKNRSQNQLISPRHRIVRKVFNKEEYLLEPIEKTLQLKSSIAIPVVGKNINSDYSISDDEIKLLAWVLSEGSIEKEGSYRVSIYQSAKVHKENYEEIVALLNKFGFEYDIKIQKSLGTCEHIRLKPSSSKKVHEIIGSRIKKFPEFLYNLSQRQARLFLEVYIKGDGWNEKHRKRITVTDKEFADGLTAIAVLAGYNFNIKERVVGGISKKTQYIITLTDTNDDYINKIEKVDYSGIIWSVNTDNETVIARRNGQVFITGNTPFSNITLDLKVPEHLKNQAVIIGGVPQESTYGKFQKEMDMFNQALFDVLTEGDAKGRVFTFPIPTINITKDFDWDSPVVDLIIKATAKYGIPYFANYLNSDLKPEDARSMCCRLRLETRELKHRGGGLFGSNPLTGSIGVVTINLPRIGYLSSCYEDFLSRLERAMDIAKTSLEIKRKVLERFTDSGLYPYSKHYLSSVKEKTGFYWSNHFSTIGIIGMNEAIANAKWLNTKGIWTQEGKSFALQVLDFMRNRLIHYQEETGNLYNLEATPAEGTSYRLAKIDKQKYPDIFTQGKENPYYTNSTWLPVGFTESIQYILNHQDEIQSKYTGGTVQHLFLGEKPESAKLKTFIKKVFENYRLPYISITPTFSICIECGYIEGEHNQCPQCSSECEVYSRVVGYLRPVSNWNDGKKEEFKERRYVNDSLL